MLFTRSRVLVRTGSRCGGASCFPSPCRAVYASQILNGPDDPPQKQRHDAEQREYLAGLGINADTGIHFAGGERLAGSAMNPLNGAAADKTWKEKKPPVVVIDNLLTPEAMEGLREFCRGSTIWQRSYEGGYLGAMAEQAASPAHSWPKSPMNCAAHFAAFWRSTHCSMMWGFKYDSGLYPGIAIHADQAAVNVNFWITPMKRIATPKAADW